MRIASTCKTLKCSGKHEKQLRRLIWKINRDRDRRAVLGVGCSPQSSHEGLKSATAAAATRADATLAVNATTVGANSTAVPLKLSCTKKEETALRREEYSRMLRLVAAGSSCWSLICVENAELLLIKEKQRMDEDREKRKNYCKVQPVKDYGPPVKMVHFTNSSSSRSCVIVDEGICVDFSASLSKEEARASCRLLTAGYVNVDTLFHESMQCHRAGAIATCKVKQKYFFFPLLKFSCGFRDQALS